MVSSSSNEDGREISIERVAALREAAMLILEHRGSWEDVEGFPGKLHMFNNSELMLLYRTPFQPIPISKDAVLSGISANQQRRLARDYGLDVWIHRHKALSLIWNEGGPVAILLYRPGIWEDVLLREAMPQASAG